MAFNYLLLKTQCSYVVDLFVVLPKSFSVVYLFVKLKLANFLIRFRRFFDWLKCKCCVFVKEEAIPSDSLYGLHRVESR